MADVRKFLYHSDYPMDKVVKIVEGAITSVPAYGSKSVTMAHGLPDRPYAIGTWSFSSTFSDVKDFNVEGGDYNTAYVTPGTNATSLAVNAYNPDSVARTFYYRCILLAPYDAKGDYKTPATSNPMVLDTDSNYFKIAFDNYSTGASMNHNLGYIPHVLAWEASGGFVRPISHTSTQTSFPSVRVTNTSLIFNMAGKDRIYYRIYADD